MLLWQKICFLISVLCNKCTEIGTISCLFHQNTQSKQLCNLLREVVFTLQNKHVNLSKSMLCHVETDILTNESISQGKHIYLQMTKRLKIRDSQEILCNVFCTSTDFNPKNIGHCFRNPMIMVLACRQGLKKRHPPISGCQKNPSLGD